MTEIADIQKPFAKWLRERGLPFVQARSDEKSTISAGHPDFSVFWNGKVIFIECKTEKGNLSAKQKIKIAHLEASGCPVTIARSLEECISAVQAWIDGQKHATEAPAREKQPSKDGRAVFFSDVAQKDGLRVANWLGCDVIVEPLVGGGFTFVRVARPDDLLSIPRA